MWTDQHRPQTFVAWWAAARISERNGLPLMAAEQYLHAASMAENRTEEQLALTCAWICHERAEGRDSELEVGERIRSADGHLGATEDDDRRYGHGV